MTPTRKPPVSQVQLKVRVPVVLRRRLKIAAARTGIPMNTLVTRAIRRFLKGA